jgi:hypothetical protein
MEYQVHEFNDHLCPLCKTVQSGAVVFTAPETGLGNHYLYVGCRSCGETVSRINGFRNSQILDTEAEKSEEIGHKVITAVHEVSETKPATEDGPKEYDEPDREL